MRPPDRRPKTAQRARGKPRRQPPLYLLTGLVLGLVAGLLGSWLLFPPAVVDVPPASLDEANKDQYRTMVALAYAASGDLHRAETRLVLLDDPDPVRALVSQAQLNLVDADTQREARALSQLAAALESHLASQATASAPAEALQGDETSGAATPIPQRSYQLRDQELQCEADGPLLKVFVYDPDGNAQPGARIVVSSGAGQDEFFTGLKPEISPGYADFAMDPDTVYALFVEGVEVVNPLQAAACELPDGEPAWGSWVLRVDAQ